MYTASDFPGKMVANASTQVGLVGAGDEEHLATTVISFQRILYCTFDYF